MPKEYPLRIAFTKRHVDVSDALEDYVVKKSEKAAKFLPEAAHLEVVVDKVRADYRVEIIASGFRGPDLVARVEHPDARAAVDIAFDKLDHQLRKMKERHRGELHGESMAGERTLAARRPEEEGLSEGPEAEGEDDEGKEP